METLLALLFLAFLALLGLGVWAVRRSARRRIERYDDNQERWN